jgi:hypothetical protein
MALNFGSLNEILTANPNVACEAITRAGKLDREIGVVALGGIAHYDSEIFPALNAAAKAEGRTIYKKSPIELNLPKSVKPHVLFSFLSTQSSEVRSLDELNAQVQAIYKASIDAGVYFAGPYGDYITGSLQRTGADTVKVSLTGIFQKAYPLMRAASDLVLFVEGVDQQNKRVTYLVTGIRAQDPGRGKAALFGGFRNVDGLVCESGIYAALREGKEEAGIQFNVPGIEGYKEIYDIKDVEAAATVFGKSYPAKVSYVGTIPTSNLTMPAGGEVLADSSKRVHFTSGYAARIDMGKEIVRFNPSAFQAGDDMQKIKVINVSSLLSLSSAALPEALEAMSDTLSFGIAHHQQILLDSIRHIITNGPITPQPKVMSCWDKFKSVFCCLRK